MITTPEIECLKQQIGHYKTALNSMCHTLSVLIREEKKRIANSKEHDIRIKYRASLRVMIMRVNMWQEMKKSGRSIKEIEEACGVRVARMRLSKIKLQRMGLIKEDDVRDRKAQAHMRHARVKRARTATALVLFASMSLLSGCFDVKTYDTSLVEVRIIGLWTHEDYAESRKTDSWGVTWYPHTIVEIVETGERCRIRGNALGTTNDVFKVRRCDLLGAGS